MLTPDNIVRAFKLREKEMFTLGEVVPWGRSFDECRRMVALSEDDLRLNILGCADGPASFNAVATRQGCRVVSCDPLYAFSGQQIRERIQATRAGVMDQTRKHASQFVWDVIPSVDDLERCRLEAMDVFLADYDLGKRDGRYVQAELPVLPFADESFDLAVSTHFLFLYTDHFSASFHRQSIAEMCRVAREVRIFPLLTLDSRWSEYVAPITAHFINAGFVVSIVPVTYEFQRGANQMMRITRNRSLPRTTSE